VVAEAAPVDGDLVRIRQVVDGRTLDDQRPVIVITSIVASIALGVARRKQSEPDTNGK
jgi:mRNA-degrading endonuclease toxin of MazEF toxin-antitoxin module